MAFANSTSVAEELSDLWLNTDVETLETAGQKYVMMSDIHLGDGGPADDLHHNERVLLDVLCHYSRAGYTLLLLGDIEEFWQFDLEAIVRRYNDSVYAALREFGDQRAYRIFGNHDREWGGLEDPARQDGKKTLYAAEAIKLKDSGGSIRFLLVHGHQGSIDADKLAWMSRFFVRLFKLVEPAAKWLGLYGDPSATKSQIPGDYERTMYAWAKAHQVILICGHTHRAIFASKSYAERLLDRITALRSENVAGRAPREIVRQNIDDIVELRGQLRDEEKKGRVIEPVERVGEPLPCYFNTGCATYTNGITAIEISDSEIGLVKWNKNNSGPATRVSLGDPYNLDSLVAQVVDQR
jgi:UDP-2,3-diacylglucosamine pyrophosphatase LpxH